MLWFFQRDEESLRLLTAYDNDTKEFVATIIWSHGRQDQQRFATVHAFRDWLKAFEMNLEQENWRYAAGYSRVATGGPNQGHQSHASTWQDGDSGGVA